jgi:hypothetical protein
VSDNITLPRELVQETLEALERYATDEAPEGWHAIAAITALRARLAAPRPEPVLPEAITCGMPFVIKHYTADLRPTIKGNGFDGLEIGISREEAEEFVAWVNARIAAPPAAAPKQEPVRHPGYVIGNHWLETAYERICAGESEDAILEDYELVREPRLRDLRWDAERYRRLLKWLIVTGLLSRERCRIDSPASFGDWWVLRKPHGVGVLVLGYGQTEDAAINAAMEDKT